MFVGCAARRSASAGCSALPTGPGLHRCLIRRSCCSCAGLSSPMTRHRPRSRLVRALVPSVASLERGASTARATSRPCTTTPCRAPKKKNLMRSEHAQRLSGRTTLPWPGATKCTKCACVHYGVVKGNITVAANAPRGAGRSALVGAGSSRVSEATAPGNGVVPDGDRVLVVPTSCVRRTRVMSARLTALLPPGEFMLFVGDLRPMKGLDVLLAAYAGLGESMPLVLIGKSWPDTPRVLPAGVTVHDRWPNAAVLSLPAKFDCRRSVCVGGALRDRRDRGHGRWDARRGVRHRRHPRDRATRNLGSARGAG